MKEYQKAASRIGFGMALFLLVSQVAQLGLLLLLEKVFPMLLSSMSAILIVGDIAIYGIGFPCLWLVCRSLPNTKAANPPKSYKMTPKLFLRVTCMAFAVLYITNFAYMFIMSALSSASGYSLAENPVANVIMQNSLLERIILFCVLPPVLEELVFRKYLYQKVGVYGNNAYILASGLCFGMFHANLSQFVYAFGLGALFAWLYLATGTVVWGMAVHTVVNLMGSVIAPMALQNMLLAVLTGLFVWVALIGGVVIFVRASRTKAFSALPSVYPKQNAVVKSTLLNVGMITYLVLFAVCSLAVLIQPNL